MLKSLEYDNRLDTKDFLYDPKPIIEPIKKNWIFAKT